MKEAVVERRRCAECRDGEHDNIDEDIELVYVRDAKTKRIMKRAWLCEHHQTVYLEDGWEVRSCP